MASDCTTQKTWKFQYVTIKENPVLGSSLVKDMWGENCRRLQIFQLAKEKTQRVIGWCRNHKGRNNDLVADCVK
jgi:hypothetical protein